MRRSSTAQARVGRAARARSRECSATRGRAKDAAPAQPATRIPAGAERASEVSVREKSNVPVHRFETGNEAVHPVGNLSRHLALRPRRHERDSSPLATRGFPSTCALRMPRCSIRSGPGRFRRRRRAQRVRTSVEPVAADLSARARRGYRAAATPVSGPLPRLTRESGTSVPPVYWPETVHAVAPCRMK